MDTQPTPGNAGSSTSQSQAEPSQPASTSDGQPENGPIQGRLAAQNIRFANKNSAILVAPPAEARPEEIVSALGLQPAGGLLLMVGHTEALEEQIEL